jgi:hypothetical protein
MAVAKSLDKILFLYTEHTDNTVSSVKMTEKLRPLREIRVQRASNLDFAKALSALLRGLVRTSLFEYAWKIGYKAV